MQRRRYVPRSEDLESRKLLSVAGIESPAALRRAVVAEVQRTAADLTRVPPEAYQNAAASRSAARRLTINPEDPNIAPLRKFKIERLPNLLQSVQRGRYIPPEIITALQADLTAISGTLRPPPSTVLQAFNLQLRSTISQASVSVEDAAALNRIFGLVLARAGAPADVVEKFQANMLALTHVDVRNRTPALVLANDYAVILQTSMGVGIDFQAFHRARPTPGRR